MILKANNTFKGNRKFISVSLEEDVITDVIKDVISSFTEDQWGIEKLNISILKEN